MKSKTVEPGLLSQLILGNRDAFGILYSDYREVLYKYIYCFTRSRELSEDIIQEMFIKLWEEKDRLQEVTSFGSYLFRMARNKAIDHLRSRQLRYNIKKRIETEIAIAYAGADHKMLFNDYYTIAFKAINKLPARRKLIFCLSTQECLSLDEIAVRLNISKSVVKKQLYAGIAFVKHYLSQHAGIAG